MTWPEPVKTTKRCQHTVAGKRVNCRRFGQYELSGRRYCAPHYRIAWEVANPLYGQQHDWHLRQNSITGAVEKYETCRRCGAIKVYPGLPQCLCRGLMPRIELRINAGKEYHAQRTNANDRTAR